MFWAMLNKQYITASKFRKGTKSSSCLWFLGCFKPICALLTRIRVDRNDCCIYEGYATRNIENIEQCNHSLFCLNMPPFLPMLWAVATQASISGIKMSFWILLWNRYAHYPFLFVCLFPLTGRIIPELFLFAAPVLGIWAACRFPWLYYFAYEMSQLTIVTMARLHVMVPVDLQKVGFLYVILKTIIRNQAAVLLYLLELSLMFQLYSGFFW